MPTFFDESNFMALILYSNSVILLELSKPPDQTNTNHFIHCFSSMKQFSVFQKEEKKTKAVTYQYMVDFKLPENLSQEFMARVPIQRKIVNRYFRQEKLVSYAISLESSRIWAIFKVTSEVELMKLLADLPLTSTMKKVNISSLSMINMPQTQFPVFSES
jgi:muconolactone delta-isomerase